MLRAEVEAEVAMYQTIDDNLWQTSCKIRRSILISTNIPTSPDSDIAAMPPFVHPAAFNGRASIVRLIYTDLLSYTEHGFRKMLTRMVHHFLLEGLLGTLSAFETARKALRAP